MPRKIPFVKITSLIPTAKRKDQSEAEDERRRFYTSTRWRKCRAAYLAQHPWCQECESKGLLVIADTVHHKIERLDAPDLAFDFDNLQALCGSCHSRLHANQNQFRPRVRDDQDKPL